MAVTKPDLTRVWALGAPGANIVDPDVADPGKFDAGWVAEIPPFEYYNFLQQLYTQGLAHINEQGVAEWDTDTIYPKGALVKGSNGVLYKSEVATNTGNDPITSPITEWSIAFANANFYADSGAADVYVLTQATGSQAAASYTDGMPVTFRPDFSNTGASTIDVEGLGVKNIKTSVGGDPAAGVLVVNELITLVYDLANDWFEIFESFVLSATTSIEGVVELATSAETIAGVDLTKAITPARLQAKIATDVNKGIIELATQAEVDAGTDTERAIVPDTLANSVQVAKAWVSFNGIGVVAINDSFNVSSITDVSTGTFTANFINNMNNADYMSALSSSSYIQRITATTISGAGILTYDSANTIADFGSNGISVLAD